MSMIISGEDQIRMDDSSKVDKAEVYLQAVKLDCVGLMTPMSCFNR